MALTAFRAKGDYALKTGGLYVLDTSSGEITGMGGTPVMPALSQDQQLAGGFTPPAPLAQAPIAVAPPVPEPPPPPPPPPAEEKKRKVMRPKDVLERQRNEVLLYVADHPDCLARAVTDALPIFANVEHPTSEASTALTWLKTQGYTVSREEKVEKGRGSAHGYILHWTVTKKGAAAAETILKTRKEVGVPFVKALA